MKIRLICLPTSIGQPFFHVLSLTRFDLDNKDEKSDEGQIRVSSAALDVSPFGKALLEGEEGGFAKALGMVKEMGPSAIDTEIRYGDRYKHLA